MCVGWFVNYYSKENKKIKPYTNKYKEESTMAIVILHKDFERINKENEMNNIVTDTISIRKLVDGYWGVENLHNLSLVHI